MAFLTLHELLPLAFDYAGQKQAVKAVFVGMAVMSARFVDVSEQKTFLYSSEALLLWFEKKTTNIHVTWW